MDHHGPVGLGLGSEVARRRDGETTGSRLLALELAHVAQQREATTGASATGCAAVGNRGRTRRPGNLSRRRCSVSALGEMGADAANANRSIRPPRAFRAVDDDQCRPGVGRHRYTCLGGALPGLHAQRLVELLVATPIPLSRFGASWTAAGHDRFVATLGPRSARSSQRPGGTSTERFGPGRRGRSSLTTGQGSGQRPDQPRFRRASAGARLAGRWWCHEAGPCR